MAGDVRDKFKNKIQKSGERGEKFRGKGKNKKGDDLEVGTIWKQGFPMATDEDKAIKDAEDTARAAGITAEIIGDPEIIATDAHVEAGEFLVKLLFAKEPKRPEPDPGT